MNPGDTYSRTFGTTIGSESLTTVFGMGTGVAFQIWSPERDLSSRSRLGRPRYRWNWAEGSEPEGTGSPRHVRLWPKSQSVQQERWIHVAKHSPVSTGKLSALLRLHIRPINLVVFQGASEAKPLRNLILERASRLDAFSVYPFRP